MCECKEQFWFLSSTASLFGQQDKSIHGVRSMKIFLVIAWLVSGSWIQGKDLPHGWWPSQHDSLESCLAAAKFFNERAADTIIKTSHSIDDATAFCVVVSEENTNYD